MKIRTFLPLTLSMLALTGCIVTSVYPFYSAKDVKFEPALAGDWTESDNADAHWNFQTNSAKAYQATQVTKDGTNVMQATFFKIHDQAFLDFFAISTSDDAQPPPIPSHMLVRVSQITPTTLRMATMSYDWLVTTLTNTPSALRHHFVRSGDDSESKRLVLTADTKELQRFVMKHLGTEDAWEKSTELVRAAAKSSP